MKQLNNPDNLSNSAGRIVKLAPESTEWFAIEGIFGDTIMLKEFTGHRLYLYDVREATLLFVEPGELARELGTSVIEMPIQAFISQKKTDSAVFA